MRVRLSLADSRLPQPNSHLATSSTSTMPPAMPPVLRFPRNGITPPHPHPVAPFPPPPHPHGTLQHGPVPPAPPPSAVISPHPQPFYSLAMNRLPPNIHYSPHLPRTLTSSPYHPLTSSPQLLAPRPTAVPASRPSLPVHCTLPQRPTHPATVGVTCNNCGHYLLVHLSGSQWSGARVPPTPPPRHASVASTAVGSLQTETQFWKQPLFRPQATHPLNLAPPFHHSGSAFTAPIRPTSRGVFIPPVGRVAISRRLPSSGRNSKRTSNTLRSPRPKVRKGGNSVQEVVAQSTARIIPYRERRKQPSLEVYAQQKLELEFAAQQKPSLVEMGELAGRLGVSKDFVRQWFSNRRKRQKMSSETSSLTIPSGTHNITVEIPLTDTQEIEETPNPTVVICPSQK